MNWRVDHADIMEWPGDGLFHAVLTDPPYHLGPKGFMGRRWDAAKYGVSFRPETWARIAEHLLPGGFIFAFGGSRTWHRMAVAIEDAGLIIHPTIGWLHGVAFPKAARIDTKVDKAKGESFPPLAKIWAGHRYGLQALKPTLELIICAQKPYAGKPVDSIVATGAGAFWIEGGRIPIPSGSWLAERGEAWLRSGKPGPRHVTRPWQGPPLTSGGCAEHVTDAGRWPPNFAFVHHPDCRKDEGHKTVGVWECHPDCPARKLDEWVGMRDGAAYRGPSARQRDDGTGLGSNTPDDHSDRSGPSRFFLRADWNAEAEERIAGVYPVYYSAKASRREKDAGLSGEANGPSTPTHNPHPTVKPIALCRWLAKLALPPPEYAPRRILIPFAGTGSEMIGALQAGWEEVVGVELEAEYVDIARARLAYWAANPTQLRTGELGER